MITTNTMSQAIEVITESIACEVTKNLQSTIERKVEDSLQEYMSGKDFSYLLEDIIRDKMTSIVEDHVADISLSIRID